MAPKDWVTMLLLVGEHGSGSTVVHLSQDDSILQTDAELDFVHYQVNSTQQKADGQGALARISGYPANAHLSGKCDVAKYGGEQSARDRER